jgi:hypothetical protein
MHLSIALSPKGVKGAFIVKGTKYCVYTFKIPHPLDFEK